MNLIKSIFAGNSSNLSAEDAQARLVNKQPLVIVDVRQPNEFRAGHIQGAKLIPLNELSQRMNELPRDTDILCVCHSGSRSSAAVNHLTRAGYRAFNLRGGLLSWQHAGYPVKKGK